MRMRVGLDIGGTKTHAVVVDERGELTHEVRLPTGFGADAVIATAATAVRRLAELAHIATHEFASVGVGIPGTVDRASGRVSHAVNLGLAALSLADELTRVVHVDVRVENDVNAAAVGAYRLLGGASGGSMAYLNLGTGLAAGLVLDGELWRGSRGTAGEIGHIPVDPRGERCPCGQFGCLELVASGSAVARWWPTSDPSPVRALFDSAAAGDAAAVEVRGRLVDNVAAAVRILVLSIDVERVVIGGGVSSLGQELLSAVRGTLERWASASPFLASLDLAARVTILPAGFPAAAVGAALVGMANRKDGE